MGVCGIKKVTARGYKTSLIIIAYYSGHNVFDIQMPLVLTHANSLYLFWSPVMQMRRVYRKWYNE
jgi:hypothetical protein